MNLDEAVDAFFTHYDGESGGYFTRDGAMPSGGRKEKRLGETAAELMKQYSSSRRNITALNENEDYVVEVDYNPSNDKISLNVSGEGQKRNIFRSELEEVNLHQWTRELEKIRRQYEETGKIEAPV
ncbi:MAG: hypothetical protein ABEK16_06650 [Candidatus Nanohalobium sp.]